MQFEESKHPRDGDGKFTDKGGGEAKRVFELADELGVPYDRNTSYQTVKARVEEAQKNEVVELSDDNELARLIASSDEKHWKVISNYIMEKFGGSQLTLSDGSQIIIDKRDARKLSNRVDDKRVAELAELRNITQKAKYLRSEKYVEHNKFSEFKYYWTKIRFQNQDSGIYLNIGKGKNDNKYHLYAITKAPMDDKDA